ncbi:hypothetical protein IM660_13250 [Ruania alkalisoli]|uniref:Uncharacterized protein n=1 Tax=Ruania alkalisoli TaxID=2779775 RepID=A0A7M1SSQ1_9MICO|nr:hypothetical protein [Ruania alkalisoli]QOR69633.1 hypothetical protein IM660_13250 [Ruania alkalisoli]
MSTEQDWARQRREAAAEHERRLVARQASENARAQRLLDQFVRAAEQAGLPAHRLEVQGYGGRGSARTPRRGWYLRVDRTAAVGTDGSFYVLTAPLSLWDRLRGVEPEAKPPPLVLGAGGKDGDSIDLRDALDRLLPGWANDQDQPHESAPGS